MTVDTRLVKAIKDNRAEVQRLILEKPNWKKAQDRFNQFYDHLSNRNDKLWSDITLAKLYKIYFDQRDKDKGMSNITLRTIAAVPDSLKNDIKTIFLQIADVCCIFNASHKVNFEPEELPVGYAEISMKPGKGKGSSTYADPLPSIYNKISLTFDYWGPRILEWSREIRDKGLREWKHDAILQHESCTDFMRICLMFLSDPSKSPPVAKADDREKLLGFFGKDFVWIKKSAKREDILSNNKSLVLGFTALNRLSGTEIPNEAWTRVQQAPFIKSLLK